LSTILELFLQGGLGNQLIQQAYAESLVRRSGSSLRLNLSLLSPAWAALRRVSYRERAHWVKDDFSEIQPWPRQLFSLLCFYHSRQRGSSIHDGVSDASALTLLGALRGPGWIPLLGYMQRAQAFGPFANCFWTRLAQRLHRQHQLQPYPCNQVALHVRLGDYLLPQNQHLYAPLAIQQQLHAAFAWREHLGGEHPLHVITDDPVSFNKLCPDSFRSDVHLLSCGDSKTDFLALACHRRIVASNSTFSLCAGKLSAMLWDEAGTTLLPRYWYRESVRDAEQQREWCQLDFVVDVWHTH